MLPIELSWLDPYKLLLQQQKSLSAINSQQVVVFMQFYETHLSHELFKYSFVKLNQKAPLATVCYRDNKCSPVVHQVLTKNSNLSEPPKTL